MTDLAPKYNPNEVEKGRYQTWLDEDLFKPSGDKKAHPYSIVIPPPNVTGKLHLGHAWDTAIQDTLIRFKRMQGYDTLYLPGMDHAGIATQAKVEAKLRKQGKDRHQMGREKFVKQVWDWKDEYAAIIKGQWAKMGLSLDYSRERFTLDKGLSKAVKKVFVQLYNEGLIYRGEYIINWDPALQTALSDIEVIHKDDKGAFYHIKYPFADGSGYVEIATTRPETMFGDTAVAVADEKDKAPKLAGLLRNEVGRGLDLIEKDVYKFCWIVDFPMYEINEETGEIEFSHNPFSMPQGGMEALETKDPLDILAYQYDIVCNGIELSSGAVRNHDSEIMIKAFSIAGYGPEVVESKFPALFNAFKYGAPPHAGIAPGVDRMIMLLKNEPNIREIIAFPMNKNAQDLLMNAPGEVTQKQLDEIHISLKPVKKD